MSFWIIPIIITIIGLLLSIGEAIVMVGIPRGFTDLCITALGMRGIGAGSIRGTIGLGTVRGTLITIPIITTIMHGIPNLYARGFLLTEGTITAGAQTHIPVVQG